MYSAPGVVVVFFFFSQSPLWMVHEVRRWASWSNRKRTWEHLLPVLHQQPLLCLPETCVQRGKFLSPLMFKPGDYASEGVQLECSPDGGFVCSVLVCMQWERTLQEEARWSRRWPGPQPIGKERGLIQRSHPDLVAKPGFTALGSLSLLWEAWWYLVWFAWGTREDQKEVEIHVFELQLCHF